MVNIDDTQTIINYATNLNERMKDGINYSIKMLRDKIESLEQNHLLDEKFGLEQSQYKTMKDYFQSQIDTLKLQGDASEKTRQNIVMKA